MDRESASPTCRANASRSFYSVRPSGPELRGRLSAGFWSLYFPGEVNSKMHSEHLQDLGTMFLIRDKEDQVLALRLFQLL